MKKAKDEMKGRLTRVDDFLPPPDELFWADNTKKVTMALDETTLKLFKNFAKGKNKSYQQMIRIVLRGYAKKFL